MDQLDLRILSDRETLGHRMHHKSQTIRIFQITQKFQKLQITPKTQEPQNIQINQEEATEQKLGKTKRSFHRQQVIWATFIFGPKYVDE